MNYFSSNLKYLREKNGMEQLDLAKRLGRKSSSSVSEWEQGKYSPKAGTLSDIAAIFGVTLTDLMERDLSNEYSYDQGNSSYGFLVKEPSVEYNYFPVSVSAGIPMNIEGVEEAESITIPSKLLGKHARNKNIFFMRVNGESMNKIIPHGSLIAVKRITVEDLKDGDIVVYSNNYDYSVKRFYKDGDKLIFKPESTDPKFTDHIVNGNDNDEIMLHGKVVTYIVNLD